ncbi:Flagellar motor switch protein FliG [Roseovarius sp. EC-HK134]|uniref:flagellar motor switch protein FliG n=1 Tax=unclassified Roseovarius TaxID=2614913 RepID=UPI001252A8FF|nr:MULTISPECIES: FliG C-terminal domain-containing protein [unclassified Roseovarius]VVT03557.1 Flagellar motor switch protein FliG [Roseovarius sp. EC-HK134]VVT03948.1 Flagellar motor switch protein FliG [Roseovarius sp. EC-SD190]
MKTTTPLARLSTVAHGGVAAHLTRVQKAAIIVRFLINEGAEIALTDLPDVLQARLTTQMGSMRYVDRGTLADVVAEFAQELEGMGLTFPRGVAGALSALDGRISPQTAARLRKEAGVRQQGDPWEQVKHADLAALIPIVERESTEIAAVLLSKLDVARAADLLGKLPGELARRITYAVSQTGAVSPEAVDRIGLALAAELHDIPETAFAQGAVERVGAILNFSPAATRDDVLTGLDEADQDFANLVRRAIFTFVHIPERVKPTDIPRITREVDQAVLVTALAGAASGDLAPVAEFILSNMGKRMAEAMREEIQERGRVRLRDAEEAMTAVVNAVRTLEAASEIAYVTPEEDQSA